MSEFKIGDRVKVVHYETVGLGHHHVGDEGVVTGLDAGYVLVDTPNRNNWPYKPTEIELIEPTTEEEDYAVEVDEARADEGDVAAILRLLGVDVTDEEMETAVDLAILLGSARQVKEANNE